MYSNLKPPVYRCIIPVDEPLDEPSAIYYSLLDGSRKKVKARPFPAWPDITKIYQPLCLPSLKRAIYFHYQKPKVTTLTVAEKLVEYWNRVVGWEIKKQISALLDSYQMRLEADLSIGFVPRLKIATNFGEDFMRQLGDSGEQVIEALVQGVVYGNLNNFIGGVNGAFAYVHEHAHLCARQLYCGQILEELSQHIHKTLHILATTENLSRKQIAEQWTEFWQTNSKLKRLVRKYEPIEEIYATYVGMRFLPPEVSNAVKPMIDEKLKEEGWYKAYKVFSDACENSKEFTPHHVAISICDRIFRILESTDINSTKALCILYEMFRNEDFDDETMLAKTGISVEAFDSVAETYEKLVKPYNDMNYNDLLMIIRRNINNFLLSGYFFTQEIRLVGHYSERHIIPCFPENKSEVVYGDGLTLSQSVFYESLRQQLCNRRFYGCPYRRTGGQCIHKEELRRIYDRLPKNHKKYFNQPD